jgi:NADP-dependent 3-hydroxy acid dehydrogenase YdfG
MPNPLNGTVALVTGASSGIGAATARALAAHGAAVALVARRADRLDALAGEVRAAGGTALPLAADITDERQAHEAVERAVAELGRLDTLVNDAGVMLLGFVEGAPLEDWRRMVEVNLLGLTYCTHAALPHLLTAAAGEPRGVADLVNVSSAAGRGAHAGGAVYTATKHAVGAFSESLRQEVTGRQVRVSLIEPGVTETELEGHNPDYVRAVLDERYAGIERLRPDDVAEAIGYVVTRPPHVAVNEMLLRPTKQVS